MKNQMVVFPGTDGWTIQYRGPHAARIRHLFGSDMLPTPYTLARPRADVVAELQRLNPDVEIIEA